MKNYYDELEVSKTASKEVIQKVYKVLAKKYHPDTTNEADKQLAEEKFKAVSEAYEILSDDEKRKNYDLELENSNPTISYEDYLSVVNERNSLNNSLTSLRNELYELQNRTANSSQQYYQRNTQDQYYHQTNNPNINSYDNQQQNPQQNIYHNTPNNNSSKRKTYYYTSTGKPASAFAYFKYRIKEFLSSIGLLLLTILAVLLAINAFFSLNLFSFFIK